MNQKKVIVCIKGGLGNQLFCYAAGRRLALKNDAELVIDDVTGFARDYQYRREYALDNFCIRSRKAVPAERLEPCGRYRRRLIKFINKTRPFVQRRYLEQDGLAFDSRLLTFQVSKSVYLDGYWQSENYFKDVADSIREEFQVTAPSDKVNLTIAESMQTQNSVCVHVRWFDNPQHETTSSKHNLPLDYYKRSFDKIIEMVEMPHFYLFSDDAAVAREILALPNDLVTYVNCNQGDENAYKDLWLMARCKHYIIANSTFSWWGAWLTESTTPIIIAPAMQLTGMANWGFPGLIPDRWLTL